MVRGRERMASNVSEMCAAWLRATRSEAWRPSGRRRARTWSWLLAASCVFIGRSNGGARARRGRGKNGRHVSIQERHRLDGIAFPTRGAAENDASLLVVRRGENPDCCARTANGPLLSDDHDDRILTACRIMGSILRDVPHPAQYQSGCNLYAKCEIDIWRVGGYAQRCLRRRTTGQRARRTRRSMP